MVGNVELWQIKKCCDDLKEYEILLKELYMGNVKSRAVAAVLRLKHGKLISCDHCPACGKKLVVCHTYYKKEKDEWKASYTCSPE